MNLVAAAINHHTAPVEVREAVHLNKDEIYDFIKSVKGNIFSEGVIISTCNRTEIYGVTTHKDNNYQPIINELLKFKNTEDIKPEYFSFMQGKEAVEHLFRVISGIDSLLIGDNQIFSQVKEAFQISDDAGFSGFLIKRICDLASKTGKRAINETSINEGAVTVSYAAVQLIEKIFSSLSKKSALVIGAGETGEIAAKHLKERGIGKLTITNRTYEKANNLAKQLSASVIEYETFTKELHNFDIVLSATSAPNLIIKKSDIAEAMKVRNYQSLILMDIAIPRDIDPLCKEVDYVFYNDIDSLNIIVQQNLKRRSEEIPKVEGIINQEVDNFISWYNSLEAGPTIKILREAFEAIRLEEVEKNINRFSDEDREKLEIITKRIINKILHKPTTELKKLHENNSEEVATKISLLRNLFGLDEEENNKEK